MYNLLKKITWHNTFLLINFLVSILLNIGLWVAIYMFTRQYVGTETAIPLHYNIIFGIDLVGHWKQLFVMPSLGLGIFVINAILAYIIYKQQKLASYFLALTSLITQVVLLVSLFFIILTQF